MYIECIYNHPSICQPFFQKGNGHFIDAVLTENGTDPIKLIRHACQNVSETQNESYFKIKDREKIQKFLRFKLVEFDDVEFDDVEFDDVEFDDIEFDVEFFSPDFNI